MNLSDFDLIIINSSGGKDSLCAIFEVCRIAKEQNYPFNKIVVSHQDLGKMEWEGTKALTTRQAELFGLDIHFSKRRDKNGVEEDLLQYVKRRGMWPSNKQRWCTSDFKRGPGARVVTSLTKESGNCNVLHVFGFRKVESPSRKKKVDFNVNKMLTTKKRKVFDWLPIHDWSTERVWKTIKTNNLPYHNAYQLGMPRLSCVFCIFSPFEALVVAGKSNPELLDDYIKVEKEIGHSFRDGFSIASVKEAIEQNQEIVPVKDWVM